MAFDPGEAGTGLSGPCPTDKTTTHQLVHVSIPNQELYGRWVRSGNLCARTRPAARLHARERLVSRSCAVLTGCQDGSPTQTRRGNRELRRASELMAKTPVND